MSRFLPLIAVLFLVLPRAGAQGLPDLGDASSTELSPQMERRLGESVMRNIRRNPDYVDDPEVQEYLGIVGARLVAASPGARGEFEFFGIRDASVNAFAMPGGFIGVHTGLITASDTESELASVLAHEIAHVTQRHIARQVSDQAKLSVPVMLGTIAALLAARSGSSDVGIGVATALQGVAVQRFLNFSRDFEREADRLGIQALANAGFDPAATPIFFEKLQRATRGVDDGSFPGYLRTHPMNTERIADAQARVAGLPYRQHADSLDYHLVRAKLRAEAGDVGNMVSTFQALLRDRRFASEAGTRFGLATALLRANRAAEAAAELARLRALGAESPMVETLAARIREAQGDSAGALATLRAAIARYPNRRPVVYAYVAALQAAGRAQDALALLAEQLRFYPRDPRLHAMQARAYAALGKRLLQHRSQAEVYALQGSLVAAIEQLQLAQTAGDGDFYEHSAVDARLRALRDEHQAELREEKRR